MLRNSKNLIVDWCFDEDTLVHLYYGGNLHTGLDNYILKLPKKVGFEKNQKSQEHLVGYLMLMTTSIR
jgi:hypothetical protein